MDLTLLPDASVWIVVAVLVSQIVLAAVLARSSLRLRLLGRRLGLERKGHGLEGKVGDYAVEMPNLRYVNQPARIHVSLPEPVSWQLFSDAPAMDRTGDEHFDSRFQLMGSADVVHGVWRDDARAAALAVVEQGVRLEILREVLRVTMSGAKDPERIEKVTGGLVALAQALDANTKSLRANLSEDVMSADVGRRVRGLQGLLARGWADNTPMGEILAAGIHSDDDDVRAIAARLINENEVAPELVAQLAAAAQSADNGASATAFHAEAVQAALGEGVSEAQAIEWLGSSNPEVQTRAISYLRRSGTGLAIPSLLAASQAADAKVSGRAQEALQEVQSRVSGVDTADLPAFGEE